MLAAIVLAQNPSCQSLMDAVSSRFDKLRSISYIEVKGAEGSAETMEYRILARKGGYYRRESDYVVFIANSKGSWTMDRLHKRYRVFSEKGPKNAPFSALCGIGSFLAVRPVGVPEEVQWFGMKVLRVSVEPVRPIPDPPKILYYFDPKTHAELGYSTLNRRITLYSRFKDLKLNPKIDDGLFRFHKLKGWKELKTASDPKK